MSKFQFIYLFFQIMIKSFESLKVGVYIIANIFNLKKGAFLWIYILNMP